MAIRPPKNNLRTGNKESPPQFGVYRNRRFLCWDARLPFATTAANQRVVMYVTAVTNPDAGVLILNPDGSQHAYMGINKGCNPCFMNVQTLATVGTYTVWVNHHGTNAGSEAIQLNSVPADVTGTITVDGGTVTTTTTATGQKAFLTFSGTAGQQLYMDTTNLTGTAFPDVGILDPNGNWVTEYGAGAPNSSFNWYTGLLTLSLTGTYKVAIEPTNQGTFGATFQLVTVPADTTGTITVDGGPVTTTTTATGQKAFLTFSGAAGQRLYMDTTNLTGTATAYFGIRDPNGNWVTNYRAGTPNSTCNWYTGLLTLSLTGTYKVAIEPTTMGMAGATFQLVTVPTDVTGTITVDGGPVTIGTNATGEKTYLTFSGTAGQRLYMTLNNPTGTATSAGVGVMNPSGSGFWSGSVPQTAGWSWYSGLWVLPQTGTYTIWLSPNGTGTFGLTYQLVTVPPDVTGTIAVDGGSVAIATTAPGQRAYLTFTGTSSQKVYLLLNNPTGTLSSSPVGLLNPDGSTFFGGTAYSTIGWHWCSPLWTLNQNGTYKLYLTPSGLGTFGLTFTLTSAACS